MDGNVGVAVAIVLLLVVLGIGSLLGFAFGTRSIMKSKGRSGGAGFALGFFLGFFGLIIAIVLPATPEVEVQNMQRQMELLGVSPTGGAPSLALQHRPERASRGVFLDEVASSRWLSVLTAVSIVASGYLPNIRLGNYERAVGNGRFVLTVLGIGSLVLVVVALIKQSKELALVAVGLRVGMSLHGMAHGDVDWSTSVLWALSDTVALAAVVWLLVSVWRAKPKTSDDKSVLMVSLLSAFGVATCVVFQFSRNTMSISTAPIFVSMLAVVVGLFVAGFASVHNPRLGVVLSAAIAAPVVALSVPESFNLTPGYYRIPVIGQLTVLLIAALSLMSYRRLSSVRVTADS